MDMQTQPDPTAANLTLISACLFDLSTRPLYMTLLILNSSYRLDPQFVLA